MALFMKLVFSHWDISVIARNTLKITVIFPLSDICHDWKKCCNLSGGVALNVWFTTNGMCAKNNTIDICGANKQQ